MPGLILWSGPSRLGGGPVTAVATWGGENRKTGDMIQVWIVDTGIDPRVETLRPTKAACGDCPLMDGGCYVRWEQAPHTVLRKLAGLPARAGVKYQPYPEGVREDLPAKPIRIGAAGDPAALPEWLVADLAMRAMETGHGWTGYTHQWRNMKLQGLRAWLMASCEGERDMRMAINLGWRAFTTSTVPIPGAIECPAYKTDNAVQCASCKLCGGVVSGARKPSIWIEPHGKGAQRVAALVTKKNPPRLILEV